MISAFVHLKYFLLWQVVKICAPQSWKILHSWREAETVWEAPAEAWGTTPGWHDPAGVCVRVWAEKEALLMFWLKEIPELCVIPRLTLWCLYFLGRPVWNRGSMLKGSLYPKTAPLQRSSPSIFAPSSRTLSQKLVRSCSLDYSLVFLRDVFPVMLICFFRRTIRDRPER